MSNTITSSPGILIPELCTTAHQRLALHYGADLRFNEKYLSYKTLSSTDGGTGSIIQVSTSLGKYTTKKLILATLITF